MLCGFGRLKAECGLLCLGCYLALEAFQQRIDRHDAEVDIAAGANGHGVGIPLFITDN